jgi:hypothetical protein
MEVEHPARGIRLHPAESEGTKAFTEMFGQARHVRICEQKVFTSLNVLANHTLLLPWNRP